MLILNFWPIQKVDSKISYTSDVWTASNYLAFMGVTAHWIDHTFEMHSVLLDFIPLVGRHTGDNMAEKLIECLTDLKVLPKVCKFGQMFLEVLITFLFTLSPMVSQQTMLKTTIPCARKLKSSLPICPSVGIPLLAMCFVAAMS